MSCKEEKNVESALQEMMHGKHFSELVLFKHINEEGPVQSDNRPNVPFHDEVDIQLGLSITPDSIQRKGMMGSGKDLSGKLTFVESQLSSYENPEKPQLELSPNMGFRPFGFPDGKLGSIHCTINNTFKSVGTWAPSLFPHVRTYTKVCKRGSIGRSIDITRYSGYQELEQDLARRFGIEGQLEDRQRVRWKIVYVDHENDVLIVGDDPWEEFVCCVRSIKILSSQEVQRISLGADSGGAIHPDRVCGSSNGIFSLAYSGNGQNTAVARSRCMDTLIGISNLNTKRGCLPLLDPGWPNFQGNRRLKRPREQGMPDEDSSDDSDPDNLFKMEVPWLNDDISLKRERTSPDLSLFQWIPQSSSLANLMWSNCWQSSRSFVQNLAATDLSQQLDLPAPQFYQHNSLQFNLQCLSSSLQLARCPKSPAISQSSINQPKQELSSTSSSNISQFRKLLRKVTYNIESCSNNQPELLKDPSQDEEVQSRPRDKASFGAESDIQLRLSMTPHIVSMKE